MKKRWEYCISTSRTELPELGLAGWELVSVAVVDGTETFYMKRECPGLREQITLEQREQVLAEQGREMV
ncbi:hypothetical protein [Paenibacillus thalictri]|uniref:DUF4177 domain-containing protein n=1 Tax=Paenibacillus thalictri TaxID=2527873 RepID=A0A4V2J3R5_9BACL|nr:hypothetical protein [Paenibacillus thalictri]TBL75109.1 hypothetical protein EYB31_24170 [Paenibacillus thalictri]